MKNPLRRVSECLTLAQSVYREFPKLWKQPVATIRSRNTNYARAFVLLSILPAQIFLGAGWLPLYILHKRIKQEDLYGDPDVSDRFTKGPKTKLKVRAIPQNPVGYVPTLYR